MQKSGVRPAPPSTRRPSFSYKMLAIIAISLLGIIIYSNTFDSSFHFDDEDSIVKNLNIRDLKKIENIWNFWPMRFVTYLSLAANYHFNKLDVFEYHIFNLAVHLGCAIFVWYLTLLTLFTPAMREKKVVNHAGLIAFFAGAIFVSHPIQTQGVTYIIQRAVCLATFFYLGAIAFYVKSRLLQEEQKSPVAGAFYYIISLMLAVISMFTKEMVITLPLMMLLYEHSFFKDKRQIKLRYLIPFFIIILIIPFTMSATRAVDFVGMKRVIGVAPGISPWHYLLTQFKVIVAYIGLMFMPINQNLDYGYPASRTFLEPGVLASFVLLGAILITAIRMFRRHRLISFGIFWFFISLLPESSFVPIRDLMVEHRLYLPVAGYSIFLVSAVYAIFGNKSKKIFTAVLFIIIAFYSILAYNRNFVWKDDITLWSDVARKAPDKERAYNGIGAVYHKKGELDKALAYYSKAISLNPGYGDSFNARGAVYADKGDFDSAIKDFDEALRIHSGYPDAYYNRGISYQKKGNIDQAIADYNKTIELRPGYADAYANRGNAYLNKGELDKALADTEKAIELNPILPEAYYNRSIIYFRRGDYDKSWRDIQKAQDLNCRIDPQFVSDLKKALGK